jgi:1-deoxy-D-xylulose-5-phosphate synthase
MIIAVDRAGIVGDDGETHNGIYDTAFFNGIPNINVYSPAYYDELNSAFVNALYHSEGPSVIRYPRGREMYKPEGFASTGAPFDVIGDDSADIAIVTYGRIFGECYKAYERLKAEGIKVKLIKLNKIIPIPEGAVSSVAGAGKVFFFEEGVRSGGVGERFAIDMLSERNSSDYILTALPDSFIRQGKTESILKQYSLDCDGIYETVKKEIV